MINFFLEDKFMSDMDDLLTELELDEDEDILNLPDDWSLVVMCTKKEKIFQFDQDFIVNSILNFTDKWEDRFPEDSDSTFEQIKAAIIAGTDLSKMNEMLPEIHYPADEEFTITKQYLIEHFQLNQTDANINHSNQ